MSFFRIQLGEFSVDRGIEKEPYQGGRDPQDAYGRHWSLLPNEGEGDLSHGGYYGEGR